MGRYKPVSNPKKALSSRALDGAVRCCPSTQGSWHRQSGPDSCMPITSASATSARATIAPDYLLRQHVRIGRRRSNDCAEPGDHSSCSGNNVTHSAHSLPCAECAEQVFPCNRSDLASPGFAQVMTLCASCTIPPAERMPCLHKKAGGLRCCSTGHEVSRHDARARLRAV